MARADIQTGGKDVGQPQGDRQRDGTEGHTPTAVGGFDRLYVLRNQIVHGGSTWNGSVNRNQVRDGAAVLGTLLPVFIDIMMDNPHRDWGKPFYPVVD